jgi:hypothetical protein
MKLTNWFWTGLGVIATGERSSQLPDSENGISVFDVNLDDAMACLTPIVTRGTLRGHGNTSFCKRFTECGQGLLIPFRS